MKSICFYFQIHQPFRLKRYRFFNIGNDHYYFDDFSNEDIMQQIAAKSYKHMRFPSVLVKRFGAF